MTDNVTQIKMITKLHCILKLMYFYFQDEGWLMGIKESTGARGVFPANFTKQI